MKTLRILKKGLASLALVALAMTVYFLWARPYQLRWGATKEEVMRPMPGDELEPNPIFLATRAITIEGTPASVWPWLLQMGYGRAAATAPAVQEPGPTSTSAA